LIYSSYKTEPVSCPVTLNWWRCRQRIVCKSTFVRLFVYAGTCWSEVH